MVETGVAPEAGTVTPLMAAMLIVVEAVSATLTAPISNPSQVVVLGVDLSNTLVGAKPVLIQDIKVGMVVEAEDRPFKEFG